MKKLLRNSIIVGLVIFAGIQFFQPEKNIQEYTSDHILEVEQVPENIKTILKSACLDCHSNQTDYKWYHKPVPVSWMISKHIVEGKEELNLSEWGKTDIYEKITTLEEMCSEIERGNMPLKSYTTIHRKAKLTDEQKKEFCEWSEQLALQMLEKMGS